MNTCYPHQQSKALSSKYALKLRNESELIELVIELNTEMWLFINTIWSSLLNTRNEW